MNDPLHLAPTLACMVLGAIVGAGVHTCYSTQEPPTRICRAIEFLVSALHRHGRAGCHMQSHGARRH